MGEKYVEEHIQALTDIIEYFPKKLAFISEKEWTEKRQGKWSKKEVLGHLVDSAFNNLQRYIRVQYEEVPHIVYYQNEWVQLQNWQNVKVEDIITLWIAINKQIVVIWLNFPKEKVKSRVNVSKDKEEIYTFAELIEDYIQHFKHHAKQIIPKMITVIAAIGKNNELGKGNDLIWHLPADLKRFKKTTSGHHILMGRNTFESIGKPLPNRTTIIITRDKSYTKENCLIAHSVEEALELAKGDDEIFIIGGAQIYAEVLKSDYVDKLDITHVHQDFEADVYFPEIDTALWKEVKREDFKADEKNKYAYSFVSYSRK
ncbi:dihydrofolate reductase [Tenacibaculum sp. 190524A02b]|uniref:dihydrofolate reductase n=1 Tax=Tenacibaculum vairaonense TaxID=3137860 RepID=UPI0031FA994E